jgi:hypothetical protein
LLPVASAKPEDSARLDETYCLRVVDGRLPELIPDASLVPTAQAFPITEALPVGTRLSVPTRHKLGRICGMFCCASFTPDASLTARSSPKASRPRRNWRYCANSASTRGGLLPRKADTAGGGCRHSIERLEGDPRD